MVDPEHPPIRLPRWEIIALGVLALLHVAFAGVFILRSSFLVGEDRTFCLFDDAMVSMEYGKNWAGGDGPVWNAGERVEGYTNFLWMCVMALVHCAKLDPSTNCLVVQALGEALLLLNLGLTWVLARDSGLAAPARIAAVFMLAAHYPTNYWALEGMETALCTSVVTAGLIPLSRALRRRTPTIWALPVLGIAPLVRPECVILLALAAGWLLVACRGRLTTLLTAILACLPSIVHLLWRHSFYGDWLPNTYYLKLTGIPFSQRLGDGLGFTWLTLSRSFVLWAAVCAGLLLSPRISAAAATSFFGVLVVYQCWAGGDAWARDRFVLPALPGLIASASYYNSQAIRSLTGGTGVRAGMLSLAALAVAFNADLPFYRECSLADRPFYTRDNRENVYRALAIRELTEPDATMAVSWAGAPPYFADRKGIDLLGKNDAYIARQPARGLRRAPGHNKWNVEYSLDGNRPDVIAARRLEIFRDQESFNYYNRYYCWFAGREVYFWVRYDSGKVLTSRMYRTPREASSDAR